MTKRIVSLRAASRELQPSAVGRPCPRAIPALDDVGFDVHSSLLESGQLEPSYDVDEDVRPGSNIETDRLGLTARRVGYRGRRAQVLSNVHSGLEHRLPEGHWESSGETDPFAPYSSWRERLDWELVIVTDSYRAPVHDGTTFIEGIVRGRAYLYDFAADEVVCAALVDARSSPQVAVTFDPSQDGLRQNQALIDDLHDNAFTQTIERLKAAEPRTAPGVEGDGGDEPAPGD